MLYDADNIGAAVLLHHHFAGSSGSRNTLWTNQSDKQHPIRKCKKEVQIGNTLYRVTSVFTGEKDLGRTPEELAIRRAMAELAPDAAR